MKRRLSILVVMVTTAVSAIVLLMGMAGMAAGETSRVRLVQAIPGAPAVRVLIDGETAYPSISYSTVTTYTTLSAGLHTVEVRTVLFDLFVVSETLPLVGGIDLTIAGIGTTVNPSVTLLVDNNNALNSDTVRLVNLSSDTPAMDATLTGTLRTAELSGLPYPMASSYITGLGVGEVALEVRAASTVKTLDPPTATLYGHAIHTLFVMGRGNTLDLVATVDQQFAEPKYKAFLPLVRKADTAG